MEQIDLAKALIRNDYDKECKLNCGKAGWGKDGHASTCPFAIAYRYVTPEAPPPLPASPDSAPPGRLWHIQEGFTLNLSGEILSLSRDDEAVRFHIDEIDDVISALERAKSRIQAKEIKATEAQALARWGKERTPADVV